MTKYDVMCPMCCGVFHETNGRFRKDVPAKGDMFDAKQHVKDAGWSTFPPYDTTEYSNIVCPSCDGQYLDTDGLVIRLIPIGEVDTIDDVATDSMTVEPLPSLTETYQPTAEEINAAMDALMEEYEPDLPETSETVQAEDTKNSGKVPCPHCGEMFAERGLKVHVKSKHPDA